jgi:hypothetical protein
MNTNTEGRFISRGEHGVMACCTAECVQVSPGDGEGLREVHLDLTLLTWLVLKF